MIVWTKEYETGSKKLDEQHRFLIDHINLLEEHLKKPNPTPDEAELPMQLVDYLEAYANIHFEAEEKCMNRYRCPAHAANQQGHEQFRNFIRIHRRICELEGFKIELVRNLHQLMHSWITMHILKIDTQLKSCVHK